MKKVIETFLNILYPRRCPVCHDIAVPVGQRICTTCRDKLKPITGQDVINVPNPLPMGNRNIVKTVKQHIILTRGLEFLPMVQFFGNLCFN